MTRGVAIVGVGKIARDQHVPALAASDRFHLAATASRNAEVAGVPAYAQLEDLLEDQPDIDCVSLCTPPQFRYHDACRAIEAGRHVMLEKPPGATLSEVHDLSARAEAHGVTLFATWHSRHAAAVPAARDWLAGKVIRKVEVAWKEDVRKWHPGQDWIWEAGGLGVFDPGINALSVLTAIMPRAVHLRAAELFFPENRDTPITAALDFHDAAGAEITAHFDWLEQGPPHWTISILTETGTAILSKGGAVLTVDGVEHTSGPDREYPALYAHFADLLDRQASDVDLAPMRHVSDAFTLGKRRNTMAFHW